MVEAIASEDDTLMEKYCEDPESITVAELKAVLRKAVCNNQIVPMCCGTAFKNKGVQMLLDAVVDYLPSPIDVKAIEGELEDGTKTLKSGIINGKDLTVINELVIPSTVETIENNEIDSIELTTIISKTGKAFDWNGILGNDPSDTFETGTVTTKNYGTVTITK